MKDKRKNKKNKVKAVREPSLLHKLFTIYYEQAKRCRALRMLQKQSWSFDFLALLLVKASKIAGQGLSLTVTDRQGVKYTITYDKAKQSEAVSRFDDSIFNHLDDDIAVTDYITRHSVR